MQILKSRNGVSVSAYKGDAMTLLAFDLSSSRRKDLAGFTIFYTVKGIGDYIYNRLCFPDIFLKNNPHIPVVSRNSTLYSPIQKMNWLHVPNTDIDTRKAVFGEYTYEITPRYIKNGQLIPFNASDTVKLKIDVSPYNLNNTKIGFSRGFISSVAYAKRFGIDNNKVRPSKSQDKLIFDITKISGTAQRWNKSKKQNEEIEYSFQEQHEWLGWQARKLILDFLDKAINNRKIIIKAFVYDLNEPEICKRLLQLADDGRLRIIVDNSGKHGTTDSHESAFVRAFKKTNADTKDIERGKFGALSHSKLFIQINNGVAESVLSGSTNFSTNGLYINSNHVLIFDNSKAAKIFEQVFDSSFGKINMDKFKGSELSKTDHMFVSPKMTITFAPHKKVDALRIFNRITTRIDAAKSDVLFAIMTDKSKSGILDSVKKKVKSDNTFTYGITDTIGKTNKDYTVYLYRPDSKKGIRVAAKGIQNVLPQPFGEVPGVVGYAIHHKFIVVDFKGPDPVVYCGSSNLAFGPEQRNGDNLLEIKDKDIVTAFAIEALRLVDHFHWRNYENLKSKPMSLDDLSHNKLWYTKWFTSGDLYCRQRELYIRP